ncbi:MAG TPA: hypothetical protein PKG48_07885 [Bacteroidales bacterium]|nr:hypothetical protein [Bacteroidales bacterium]
MLIYRFRVTCEEHDIFLREIEILPNQTFLDFHHILLESAELLHCERASFFMADKGYKKSREITLKAEKRQVRKYDEDLDQVVTETVSPPQMKTEKIKSYIEDPHQKMIYEFHGKDSFSFHIELYKIYASDTLESMPRCVKRSGELPKKVELPVTEAESTLIPKPPVPRKPVQKAPPALAFEDMVEDDEGLAAIENELEGIMKDAADLAPEAESAEKESDNAADDEAGQESFMFGEQESEDEFENLEHLEDFEDIDNLDRRLSDNDRDPDDY